MNYDTTRTYARTTWQAFPSERAHCIEGPQRTSYSAANVSIAIAVVVVLGLIALLSSGVL